MPKMALLYTAFPVTTQLGRQPVKMGRQWHALGQGASLSAGVFFGRSRGDLFSWWI